MSENEFDPAELGRLAAAATPGPWTADTHIRGDVVVWGPNGRFISNAQAEPHWIEYPGEKRSVQFDVDRVDAEFIAYVGTHRAEIIAAVTRGDQP